MGVTIHYRGSIDNKTHIDKFIVEMSDICDSMNWKYEVLDEDWSVPSSLEVDHQEDGVSLKGHAGLKGISFTPHEHCEPVRLTFDAEGHLNSVMNIALGMQKSKNGLPWLFSKTQFAGAEVHISIIKLLKYIHKKYVSNLEVRDEGDYWDTGDKATVNNRMGVIQDAMDALEEGLRDLGNLEDLTEDGIIKKIEEVIDKMGDQEGIQVRVMRIDSVLKKFEEDIEEWEKNGDHNELLNFFKNMPDNPEDFLQALKDAQTGELSDDELSEIMAFESADNGEDDSEKEEIEGWEDDFLDGFEEEDPDMPNPSLN
jgi:hypothetical protein